MFVAESSRSSAMSGQFHQNLAIHMSFVPQFSLGANHFSSFLHDYPKMNLKEEKKVMQSTHASYRCF
jgi:hypothetical protein